MAIKHIRRSKREQTVQVFLLLHIKGDDKPSAITYHITEQDWVLIETNGKYPLFQLPPVLRGLMYLELDYNGIDSLYDQGDVNILFIDKIERHV